MINTVTGELPADRFGFAQMHEHLFVSEGPATRKHPALLIDDLGKSAAELCSYRAAGGQSLLDAQPGGAGRNAKALQAMSQLSGIQIIPVTGFHLPLFYPPEHWSNSGDEEALYERFLGELQEGLEEDTAIRAGAVKAALGPDGLSPPTVVKLRAATRAAAKADVPLVLHTEKGFDAVKAIRLCAGMGLPPRRMLVCHVDRDAADYAVHEAVAETGAMLEYDTIGRFKYHDDESERRLILHMLEKGYEKQLLLSLDTTAERLTSYGGAIGLTYLIRVFLPLLRQQGVPEDVVRTLTVDNPMGVFL